MTKTADLRVYSPEVRGSREPVPAFVKRYGLLSEAEGEAPWTVEWDGRRLVCPRNLRLRVLESTVAFANALRGIGVGLIPDDAAKAADRELRTYQVEHPGHRSHVLTSAWHVPVRWFVAFDPDEKERAHSVLEQLGAFQAPAEELGQLSSWLEPFPEGSMVELDYSDVSDLFDPQELVFDDSCHLIQESVDALENGDMLRAGENYGRVVSRWAPAFSVTFSN